MKCMIDEVLFLRHGRTAYNLARRLQGQIDIPLDIVGGWQADQSAYELAKTYYWAKVAHIADHNDELAQPAYEGAYLADLNEINEAPAASRRMVVVSSDLFRAQQTAHAIADLLGLDVALDPRLRERSFGEWEGMTREEILEQYADDYHSWRAHTGGETKHGVEAAGIPASVAPKPYEALSPNMPMIRRPPRCSQSAMDRGSWPPSPCCSTWIRTTSTISEPCATPSGRA